MNNLINITLNSRVGRMAWVVITLVVVMACLYFAADPTTIESLRSKL